MEVNVENTGTAYCFQTKNKPPASGASRLRPGVNFLANKIAAEAHRKTLAVQVVQYKFKWPLMRRNNWPLSLYI